MKGWEPISAIEKRIRRHLKKLEPYVPIVPVDVLAEKAGISPDKVIKLDGNENPYGCSPRVLQALARYPYYHIYPDPDQRELRKAVAKYIGTTPESIVLGAGSDELIDLILRLFLDPGDKVINCVPTFGMYPFNTGICGGEVTTILRDEDYEVDVPAVKAAIDKRTKVLFLASPNNPSGNITVPDDLRELVDTGILVVVDEAYAEFSGVTMAHWITEYENLIILRTFSKWAGLAGMRVGYGLFPPKIANHIMKIKPPYNINAAAQIAVLESLSDIEYLRGRVQAIVDERPRLFRLLRSIAFLEPFPSDANFILCRVLDNRAKQIYDSLAKQGIFIRYFDTPLLRDFIRISVGKPEHTDALIEALKKMG
ncbi:MAG: histidinol-phosphate transaminase [Dehalococcoidia bacterium]|nr:histidinol-phosphate transaminase [Dehalococcoidia bacterium]